MSININVAEIIRSTTRNALMPKPTVKIRKWTVRQLISWRVNEYVRLTARDIDNTIKDHKIVWRSVYSGFCVLYGLNLQARVNKAKEKKDATIERKLDVVDQLGLMNELYSFVCQFLVCDGLPALRPEVSQTISSVADVSSLEVDQTSQNESHFSLFNSEVDEDNQEESTSFLSEELTSK